MNLLKKHPKEIRTFFITFIVLLFLSGCSSSTEESTFVQETTVPSLPSSETLSPEESSTFSEKTQFDEDRETKELTPSIAQSKAGLIYAKDSYVAAAFYGPSKNIGAGFCSKEGQIIKSKIEYISLSDHWTVILSKNIPKDYYGEEFTLAVTDYENELDKGINESRIFSSLKPMSKEELLKIGLDFLDGHCCLIGNGRTVYGDDSFGMTIPITWFDDYYFTSLKEIEGFADKFSFFSEDGRPLNAVFPGYSKMSVAPLVNVIDVFLKPDNGKWDKEKNKLMCQQLKVSHPYMIYTEENGTEQKFQLLGGFDGKGLPVSEK